MLAFRSCKESVVGPGVSKDLEDALSTFTYTVQSFGLIDSGIVMLQGSLDDDNWFHLDTVEIGEPERFQVKTVTAPHGVRYVRAYADNLEGTLPRVTVYIAPHRAGC